MADRSTSPSAGGREGFIAESSGTPQPQNYQREDTRWEQANPVRDWVILLVVIALHTSWMLVVFFFEPGIR